MVATGKAGKARPSTAARGMVGSGKAGTDGGTSVGERTKKQEELYKASGEVQREGKLVAFLYLLMRDHVPTGVIGDLMKNLGEGSASYTNGWLAKYAEHVAKELSAAFVTVPCPRCRNGLPDPYDDGCRMCGGERELRLDQIRPGSINGFPCPNGCYKGFDPKMPSNPCHVCNNPAWAARDL